MCTEQFKQNWVAGWERTRAKGRVRFVLMRGVLLFGGVMGLGQNVVNWLMRYATPYAWLDFLCFTALWFCFGFLFGCAAWLSYEWHYRMWKKPE